MKRAAALALVLAFGMAGAAWAAFGELTQPPGVAGCISDAGGVCVDGRGLDQPTEAAVSPGGRHVYVVGGDPSGTDPDHGTLATFDRDAATGALAQKPGLAGCTSTTGSDGCRPEAKVNVLAGVVVSPDGRHVYTTISFSGVATFDRDPDTGVLALRPGAAGCITDDGPADGCRDGKALLGADGLAISPDGRSLYVASGFGEAVAFLRRDPQTGELTQPAGTAACVSDDGSGGQCADGTALGNPARIAVSPDGGSVLVTSTDDNAIAVLDRDPATGRLAPKTGAAACISETGSGGACRDGRGLANATSLAMSADGRSVYVASATVVGVLAVIDRDPVTGTLTQKPGTAGCFSLTGRDATLADGACTPVAAMSIATGVAVSPDGRSVYATSASVDPGAAAVLAFDRDPATGALTAAGCVGETPIGGTCRDGRGLELAFAVTVSPDGRNAYVISRGREEAIATFNRDTSPPPAPPSPPSPPPPPAEDTVDPEVTGFRMGSRVRFTLSEPARVRVAIERVRPGRRVRGRCVKPKPNLQDRPRCRRLREIGTLAFGARPVGASAIRFRGRVDGRTLEPGAYRAVIVAIDEAGNRSAPRRDEFQIE